MSYLPFNWLFGKTATQTNPPATNQDTFRVLSVGTPSGTSRAALNTSGSHRGLQRVTPSADAPSTTNKTKRIVIRGEDCNVTAHKTGKTTWTAYGYAGGMPIQAEGDSFQLAFNHWRDIAKSL